MKKYVITYRMSGYSRKEDGIYVSAHTSMKSVYASSTKEAKSIFLVWLGDYRGKALEEMSIVLNDWDD